MGVQLPLPAPSDFSLSHLLLAIYVPSNAPQSDRVPISGTNLVWSVINRFVYTSRVIL
jgi:hypothetical protein